jgi:hypothetical protein
MLGRLEMDVDDCITAYSKLMETVFEGKSSWVPVSLRGRVKARFDSKKLRAAIEQVIDGAKASATDLFNDGKDRGCRTSVHPADTLVCANRLPVSCAQQQKKLLVPLA